MDRRKGGEEIKRRVDRKNENKECGLRALLAHHEAIICSDTNMVCEMKFMGLQNFTSAVPLPAGLG